MGIRDRPISPRSPWQNPYAERLPGRRRLFLTHFQHVEDLEAIERLGGAPDPELDARDQRDASLAPLQRCASWVVERPALETAVEVAAAGSSGGI